MKTLKLTFITLLFISFGYFNSNAQDAFKKSLKMEGRIQYDFNFLSAGDYSFSGNEFRRMRLAAKGKVAKNVSYKAEFDFAGGHVNYRDVYLKFALPSNAGSLTLGSFTEPTSLNNMTSSKYITFLERAMLANTQPFKYNAGFLYSNHFMDKKIGLQLAYTFNGDKKAAFADKKVSEGSNFTGRVSGIVFQNKEKNQVVHVGVNYENRKNDNGYHYKFRYENHMGDKYTVAADSTFKNTSDIGFELGTTFGPLSIQAEYEAGSIVGKETTKINAYYAFASYFLTGEHRPYKHGSFGRVKPKNNYGAVELAARYSVIDFSNNDGVTGTNAIGNITIGINYYLNNYTKIMYNYTNTNFNDLNEYGNDALTGHLIRFQVDF